MATWPARWKTLFLFPGHMKPAALLAGGKATAFRRDANLAMAPIAPDNRQTVAFSALPFNSMDCASTGHLASASAPSASAQPSKIATSQRACLTLLHAFTASMSALRWWFQGFPAIRNGNQRRAVAERWFLFHLCGVYQVRRATTLPSTPTRHNLFTQQCLRR